MTPPALTATAVAAVLVQAAGAARETGFAFGRLDGNIVPFTVSIANDGHVRASGPVKIGRAMLTPLQLAALNRVATETGFVKLPTTTTCKGVLPDVATTFIRVGARTVRVHGGCAPRYQRLWRALGNAVKLSLD